MKINSIQYLYALIPIFAGISNMIFVKSKWLNPGIFLLIIKWYGRWRRLFGDNKTWKGFIGMIVLTAIWTGILRIYPIKHATQTKLVVLLFRCHAGLGLCSV
jgi:hypothetical protein